MKKLKSIIGVILCVVMVLSMSSIFAKSPTFKDVPATHWAFNSIENAAANGMVTGIGSGQFAPSGTVSNSQFVTILTRACYANELATTKSNVSTWWGVNMTVGQNNGLLDGTQVGATYKNGTWTVSVVNAGMTRYDAAQVVYNFMNANYPQYLATEAELAAVVSNISDYDSIPQNYRKAVCNMYVLGILKGIDKTGRYGGTATLDRAQACIILERTFVTIENNNYLNNCPYTPVTVTRMTVETETPSTGSYQSGYLANGKPITVENIQAVLDEYKVMYPDGTPWGTGNAYRYVSTMFNGGSSGCNSYAAKLSDYIFGADAPVTVHANYDQLKVGDVVWLKSSATGYDHVIVITEVSGDFYRACSGNTNGKVTWEDWGYISDLQVPSASSTRIYSRYNSSDVATGTGTTGTGAGTTTTTPTTPTTPETPSTGTYQAGYLANGKPITVENIQEMLEEFKKEYPEGTEWNTDSKYDDLNSTLFGWAGGCNSFASMLSDYLFGKDAPVNVHTNYDQIKVGDVIWVKNSSNGYSHVVVVTEVTNNGKYRCCSGNMGGQVSWSGLNYISDLQIASFSASRVYSRY